MSKPSLYIEEMKSIFTDFAKFVFLTLKNVQLPAKAINDKELLMAKMEEFRDKYPQFSWEFQEEPTTPVDGKAALPPMVSASELKTDSKTVKHGWLKKKHAGKPSARYGKGIKYWCATRRGIFYYFDKDSSKKQKGSFPLKGYTINGKTTSKGKCQIEFVYPGNEDHNYVFSATSEDELSAWVNVLKKECTVKGDLRESRHFLDTDYEDPGQVSPPVASSKPSSTSMMYEGMPFTKENPGSPPVLPSNTPVPAKTPNQHPPLNTTPAEPETMYEEMPVNKQAISQPPPTKASPGIQADLSTTNGTGETLYEEFGKTEPSTANNTGAEDLYAEATTVIPAQAGLIKPVFSAPVPHKPKDPPPTKPAQPAFKSGENHCIGKHEQSPPTHPPEPEEDMYAEASSVVNTTPGVNKPVQQAFKPIGKPDVSPAIPSDPDEMYAEAFSVISPPSKPETKKPEYAKPVVNKHTNPVPNPVPKPGQPASKPVRSVPPKPNISSSSPSTTPSRGHLDNPLTPTGKPTPSTPIPVDDPNELYDDISVVRAELSSTSSKNDEDTQPDELYDDIRSPQPVMSPSHEKKTEFQIPKTGEKAGVNSTQCVPNNRAGKPGLPPPTRKLGAKEPPSKRESMRSAKLPSVNPDQSGSAFCTALWDCATDDSNELAFKKDDKIQIVNKIYDSQGWWIGQLGDKVGIIPKDYVKID